MKRRVQPKQEAKQSIPSRKPIKRRQPEDLPYSVEVMNDLSSYFNMSVGYGDDGLV